MFERTRQKQVKCLLLWSLHLTRNKRFVYRDKTSDKFMKNQASFSNCVNKYLALAIPEEIIFQTRIFWYVIGLSGFFRINYKIRHFLISFHFISFKRTWFLQHQKNLNERTWMISSRISFNCAIAYSLLLQVLLFK